MVRLAAGIRRNWQASLIYGAMALVVLGPLFGPGFILSLDMVFGPQLAMPTSISSSFGLHAGLHLLNLVLPGDIVEKLMLLAILWLSGIGAHRLMRSWQLPNLTSGVMAAAAYACGSLYMINPFVYSRFMAGQYSVLLGYAGLPFFVVALIRLINDPSPRKAVWLGLITTIIGVVSIHSLGLIGLAGLIATLQAVWGYRHDSQRLIALAKSGALAMLICLLASSYWLWPLIAGQGNTATAIASFQTSDQSAFDTVGDGVAGKLMHVVRLQGFWADNSGMYKLPQDALSIWGLVLSLVWLLIGVGVVVAWRQKRQIAILLLASSSAAALLAAGVGTGWLAANLPLFAGYREPQKFVGLIALGDAVMVGFGVTHLLKLARRPTARLAIGGGLVILLVGLTPVMFLNFAGQLSPRQYPADWTVMNQRLAQDRGQHQVLFLPWHLYMRYQFSGRIIANPGQSFFDPPLLVSDDPELTGTKPALTNSLKQQLSTTILPQAGQGSRLGQQLAPLGVKYVLLAKDNDYRDYGYLVHQTDLRLVSDSATLKLYLNTAFTEAAQ